MAHELFTKALEGQHIYMRPTGNNVRNFRQEMAEDGYIEAVVEKVGRVNVDLRLRNSPLYDIRVRMNPNNNLLSQGFSSGFRAYLSKEELFNAVEIERKQAAIRKQFQDMSTLCFVGMTEEDINIIYEIVERVS